MIHQEYVASKAVWKPPQVQASKADFRPKPPAVEFDPWAEAAKQLPRQEHVSKAQLAAIEANLEDRVVKKLQAQADQVDEAMAPALEPRVAQLEQQLASLQTRSGVMENKMDFLHQQLDQQTSKLEATLDTKLSEQMQRIESLIVKRARS